MAAAPYDIVDTVLNTSRVRINDAIQSLGGDVLTDTAVFSQTLVNAAWRRLQDLLANNGFQRLKQETIFTAVPAVTSSDYGSQVFISWSEYFDGTNPQMTPVLPQDMIAPYDLWERVSGTTGNFTPMDQLLNGLPTTVKSTLNRVWEWREEQIYMPGATGTTDIRLRYAAYLGDFVANSPLSATPWYQQPVPIMRSLNSLAWYICSEMAKSRGDLDAGEYDALAIEAAGQIWNRDPAQPRSIFKTSEYGKMTGRYTPLQGSATESDTTPMRGKK